jgi:cellulose synthase/poly-beta-1,6-N-acetylglucosamine synthase-like glycosyltransferase
MKTDVIIPMFNAEKTISSVLTALSKQTRKPHSIIIVDDGSTDSSLNIVKQFSEKFPVKIIKQHNQGPASARNKGAQTSKADIIIFLDADCIPKKNWLEQMLKPFSDNSVAGVVGTYETLNKQNLIARYVGYEISYRHSKMPQETDFLASYSVAYRTSIFRAFNGFDTSFRIASGEDPELSFRMKKAGHKLIFNPNAVVKHPHPETLYSYLKQQFYRGFWRIPMYKKHKDKLKGDAYTGKQALFQGLLSLLFFASFLTLAPSIILITFLLLVASNIPLGLYCLPLEKKILLLAPLLASLRSIAGTSGALYGLVRL